MPVTLLIDDGLAGTFAATSGWPAAATATTPLDLRNYTMTRVSVIGVDRGTFQPEDGDRSLRN